MNKPESQRIRDALEIAGKYDQTYGEHHKAWVIDRMIRLLCENEIEYDKFIEKKWRMVYWYCSIIIGDPIAQQDRALAS